MGFFDSDEEIRAKEEAKKTQQEVQGSIAKTGLANLVNEADLLKIIVEQNECLIQLAKAKFIEKDNTNEEVKKYLYTIATAPPAPLPPPDYSF